MKWNQLPFCCSSRVPEDDEEAAEIHPGAVAGAAVRESHDADAHVVFASDLPQPQGAARHVVSGPSDSFHPKSWSTGTAQSVQSPTMECSLPSSKHEILAE